MIRATTPTIPTYAAHDPGQPALQDAPEASTPIGTQQQRRPDRLPHFVTAPPGSHTGRMRPVKSTFNLKAGKPADEHRTGGLSATQVRSVFKAKSASGLHRLFSGSAFGSKAKGKGKGKEKSRGEERKVTEAASSGKPDIFKERSEAYVTRKLAERDQLEKTFLEEEQKSSSELHRRFFAEFQKKTSKDQDLLISFIQDKKKDEFIKQKIDYIHDEIAFFTKKHAKKRSNRLRGLIDKLSGDKRSRSEFVPTMTDEEIIRYMNQSDAELSEYIEATDKEMSRYIEVTVSDIVNFMYDPDGTLRSDLRKYAVEKGLAAAEDVESLEREDRKQYDLERKATFESEKLSNQISGSSRVMFDPDDIR